MKTGKKPYCYEYARPALTVDVAVLTREARPRVLLIRRKEDPFAGRWALPGGFVEPEEPLDKAARRELREETGVEVRQLEPLQAFGDPGRDPRGWTVSVVFVTRGAAGALKPKADDDAAAVGWHLLSRPPALAFDHERILKQVRAWLKRNGS